MKKLITPLLAGAIAVGLFSEVTAEEWKTIKFNKDSDRYEDIWAKERIKLSKGDKLNIVQVLARDNINNRLMYKIWHDSDDNNPIMQGIKSPTQSPWINAKTFYGPCELLLGINYAQRGEASMTINITRAEESIARARRYALVLPEGENGKQKLLLESSTDLVNWVEDTLGTKDSIDKKRFYRLRAVKE